MILGEVENHYTVTVGVGLAVDASRLWFHMVIALHTFPNNI